MRLVKELNCGQISCIQISWAAPVTQAADLDFSPLLHNSCPLPSNSILHLPASWLKQSNQISIYIIFLSQITNITTPSPLLIHLAAPAECSFQHPTIGSSIITGVAVPRRVVMMIADWECVDCSSPSSSLYIGTHQQCYSRYSTGAEFEMVVTSKHLSYSDKVLVMSQWHDVRRIWKLVLTIMF